MALLLSPAVLLAQPLGLHWVTLLLLFKNHLKIPVAKHPPHPRCDFVISFFFLSFFICLFLFSLSLKTCAGLAFWTEFPLPLPLLLAGAVAFGHWKDLAAFQVCTRGIFPIFSLPCRCPLIPVAALQTLHRSCPF